MKSRFSNKMHIAGDHDEIGQTPKDKCHMFHLICDNQYTENKTRNAPSQGRYFEIGFYLKSMLSLYK